MRKPLIILGSGLVVLCAISACSGGSPANAPAASPTKKWEATLGHLGAAPHDGFYAEQVPAIGDDGTIYAGGTSGLHAIRADGTEKWHFDSPGQAANVPVHFALIDDIGNIWFDITSNDSGGIARVTPEGKGGEVSTMAPATQLGSAYDGTVFLATNASMLQLSISRENPEVLLRAYAIGMAFTADGGMVFTRYLDILSSADKAHSVKWNHKITEGGCGAPVVAADGTIYLQRKGGLDAFTPDAKRIWSFDLPDRAGSPSIGDDGSLYFGSDDGNVYAVSPGGQLKWKFSAGGGIRSQPALTSNGEIIFGSVDHNLYALDSFGKLKWRFAAGGQVFSPTVAADGTIYFQSADGKLYAIQDLAQNGGLSGQWPKYGAGVRNTARAAH
jgi:outer membrane protein assembly factor BamB